MHDRTHAGVMEASVGQVAAANLRACELFARVGIRFLEDGERTVFDACQLHHADEATIAAVVAICDTTASPPAGGSGTLAEMCAGVVRHHHGPLRASLGALRTCLSAACGQIESIPPTVASGRGQLEALAESLLGHFAKEENILFPAFAALDEAHRRRGPRPPLPFATVLYPIRAMEVEHERIDLELVALAGLVFPGGPGGPTNILQDCWSHWESFSRELTAHMRFENDLLFVRALELDEQVGRSW